MKARLAALLALSIPVTAHAQGMAAMKPLYEMVKTNIIKSAELMPEANYSFKPTPAVRSFGQLIGHIADANFMFCGTVKGVKPPHSEGDFDKKENKAELVQAVKDAFAYCDAVYKMPDARVRATAELFGMKMSRLGWAFENVAHDNLHYGNVITYLRLKGLTPPSTSM